MRIGVLFLIVLCEAKYIGKGPHIIDTATNKRLKLKCLNWYGAHLHGNVVSGLQIRGVHDLVKTFASSGANCVRIPISMDLTRLNPIVDPIFISAIKPFECNTTLRAMDIMDCVVYYLHLYNILIIFNCHTSWPGWVGPGEKVSQGLWNLGGNYTTMDWIKSMQHIVQRYKIFGFDLRNEIHDQGTTVITWGKSGDINTDWLAASNLASDILRDIDNDLFIIVGGLCWNLDLRDMMSNIGPEKAFNAGKLIYTTHIYSWSFWWKANQEIFDIVFFCFVSFTVFFFLMSLIFGVSYCNGTKYSKLDECEERSFSCENSLITSIVFHVGWLIIAFVFVNLARLNGCSTLGNDAIWLIVLETILIILTFWIGLIFAVPSKTSAPWLFFWLGCFSLSVTFVLLHLQTDSAMYNFLDWWRLKDRKLPVWVGEFGTALSSKDKFSTQDPVFDRVLLKFIADQHDLDFAYWTFNADNWRFDGFIPENYGILEADYQTIKTSYVIQYLFGKP